MIDTRAYIFNIVLLVLFNLMIVTYIALLLLPSSVWFTYSSLSNVSAHGEIIMASKYTKPIKSTLEYNDVLYCDFGSGPIRFSSHVSESVYSTHTERVALWRYEGTKPLYLTVCKINSDIKTHILFGIEKTASISSQLFVYRP